MGPSLRPYDLDVLQARYSDLGCALEVRPPVIRGDLTELVAGGHEGPVLLIDGEFGQRLAVSVAEIRLVLCAGLRLHGASSMGVLRAVECRTIGMTGSGWVYERFLAGDIDADAEVALLYDPVFFEPVTVPLVNVRWLIAQKVLRGELSDSDGADALGLAGGLHFRDRRPSKLASIWRSGLGVAGPLLELELTDEGRERWDRKREDALEAFRLMASEFTSPAEGL